MHFIIENGNIFRKTLPCALYIFDYICNALHLWLLCYQILLYVQINSFLLCRNISILLFLHSRVFYKEENLLKYTTCSILKYSERVIFSWRLNVFLTLTIQNIFKNKKQTHYKSQRPLIFMHTITNRIGGCGENRIFPHALANEVIAEGEVAKYIPAILKKFTPR